MLSSDLRSPWVKNELKNVQERRGVQKELNFIDDKRILMRYLLPMAEILSDFYGDLKSLSSGYAS
jgi:GTP-binding protein LepA